MSEINKRLVYRIVYFVIHSVFSIFELINNFFIRWRTKLARLSHEFAPVNTPLKTTKGLDKIPRHITVLLGDEEPSYQDLTNFVLWSLAASIPFISFYDHKGVLKSNESEFQYIVEERKLKTDHVIWHNSPNDAPRNGYLGRKIHIKVFGEEDGRQSVVKLCRNLSGNNLSDKDLFSVDSLDLKFRKQFEFPDPDLGVCCGQTFSLFGYPPWQIRLTEFLQVKSHHRLTFEGFVNIFERYNKCEQRHGK